MPTLLPLSESWDSDEVSVGNSTVSLQSHDTLASGISLAPFFFSEPPRIPHVDSHITRNDLKYAYLKSATAKRSHKKKGSDDEYSGNSPTESPRSDLRTRRKVGIDVRTGYTKLDMMNLLRYIDSCGNNDGRISLDEFDLAMRKYKHAKLHSDEEESARKLLVSLIHLLQIEGKLPKQWFRECLATHAQISVSHSMSWDKFTEHLRVLCLNNFAEFWSQKDILTIQRFVDPMSEFDSNNELSESEFMIALRRLAMPAELTTTMKEAGFLLDHIEMYMDKNQLRVRDVFNHFNRGNHVDLGQLTGGVESILETLGVKEQNITRDRLKKDDKRRKLSSGLILRKAHKESKGQLIPIEEWSTYRKKLKEISSSGYGNGKILKVHKKKSAVVPHSLDIISKTSGEKLLTLPPLNEKKDLRRLIAASAKKYKSNLYCIDKVISNSLTQLAQDLSMRPANSHCMTDGGYVKMQY